MCFINKVTNCWRTIGSYLLISLILAGCQTTPLAKIRVINQANGLGIIEIVDPEGFRRLDNKTRKEYFDLMDQVIQMPIEASASQTNRLHYLKNEEDYKNWLQETKESPSILYIGFKACPFCQALLPKINQLAYETDHIIYGIDTVEWQQVQEMAGFMNQLIDMYQIETVPQLFLIQNGEVIWHVDNTASMLELLHFVEKASLGGL